MSENNYYEEIIINPCFVKLTRLTIIEDGSDFNETRKRQVRNKRYSSRSWSDHSESVPLSRKTRKRVNRKRICVFCENSFFNMERHLIMHIQEKPYFCRYCGKAFSLKQNWTDHQRSHTGQRPYTCSECDEGFSSYNSLDRHKRTIHQSYRIYCPLCSTTHTLQYNLRKHVRRIHNVKSANKISEILKLAKVTTKSTSGSAKKKINTCISRNP